MKKYCFPALVLLLVCSAMIAAQNGGKAEPKRIQFAKGSSSAKVTGTLSNDQEMDHVFGVRKGQTITITNSNPSLFDFRIYLEDGSFDTEYDSSKTLSITAETTGDYLLFVRKKRVKSPRTAAFSLTLSIR